MCCAYGDELDVAWIKQYNLREDHTIINRYGKIENCHVESLNGLKVDDARIRIAEMLREK
jgi:valyl-tRNA synthetase